MSNHKSINSAIYFISNITKYSDSKIIYYLLGLGIHNIILQYTKNLNY